MVNKINASIAVILIQFFLLQSAQAALIDRGSGLIYDDVLDVTWLQDASYAQTSGYAPYARLTWEDAVTWTDTLAYTDTVRGTVWDDWRLPTTLNAPESLGYDVTGTSSELAYMYYINLGYEANYNPNPLDPDPSSSNYNPFFNLSTRGHWSGTLSDATDQAWYLHFHFGFQQTNSVYDEQRIWAVRDGDVISVPEPEEMILLFSGLMVFSGLLIRRKRESEKGSKKTLLC